MLPRQLNPWNAALPSRMACVDTGWQMRTSVDQSEGLLLRYAFADYVDIASRHLEAAKRSIRRVQPTFDVGDASSVATLAGLEIAAAFLQADGLTEANRASDAIRGC